MMRGQDCHFRQNSRVILYLRLWAETSFLQQEPHITLFTTESQHSAITARCDSCLSSNAHFQQQRGRLLPLTGRTEEKKLSPFSHRHREMKVAKQDCRWLLAGLRHFTKNTKNVILVAVQETSRDHHCTLVQTETIGWIVVPYSGQIFLEDSSLPLQKYSFQIYETYMVDLQLFWLTSPVSSLAISTSKPYFTLSRNTNK